MTHFQLGKLIINYFLGLSYLTYYDLGHRLTSFIFTLLHSLTMSIAPAVSGVYASLGVEKLREVFQTSLKYLTVISTPAFLFTSVFADRIIFVWLGPGFEEAAFVLRFLSIPYFISILSCPATAILTGIGLPNIVFWSSLIIAVTTTTLSLILVVKFGLTGIIIATYAAYILGASYFFYYLSKQLGIPILSIFLSSLKFPLLASMCILLSLGFINHYLRNYYIELIFSTILFSITYILLTYRNPDYGRMRDLIRRPLFFFKYR